jgi:hypothetical protein
MGSLSNRQNRKIERMKQEKVAARKAASRAVSPDRPQEALGI